MGEMRKVEKPDTIASPFHPGEQRIHKTMGIDAKMEAIGQRVIRPYLLDQHRSFFNELPMVFMAAMDERQRPWISLRWGEPGFLNAPDANHLQVGGSGPPGDPIGAHLATDKPVGMLGMMFENRRRNRLNGTIANMSAGGDFLLKVGHSFGNCPKYIQSRGWRWRKASNRQVVEENNCFTSEQKSLLAAADTFFIATTSQAVNDDWAGHQPAAFGLDVSHRGGQPGFVNLIKDRGFEYPDYSGNYMFNTLGNLTLNSQSAYLFADFNHGHLLQCQGTTEILWDEQHRQRFKGAQRVLRFSLERVRFVRNVLPFVWSQPVMSPHNP